jgi:tRNA(Ile)-lysidine synthase
VRELLSILPETVTSAPRWWVALSGGADSVALLYGLAALRTEWGGPPISAIHVNHGLQPDAAAWPSVCRGHCEALGISLRVEQCQVEQSGRGLEAEARRVRYDVFESVLATGEVLFTAHHADDMVETVLLRLLRGAGPRGLAGIPRQRSCGAGLIFRPLLDTKASAIREAVEAAGLSYVTDPSNLETKQDRNYLRQVVLPRIGERWPGYRDTIRRAANLQSATQDRLMTMPLPRTETVMGEAALVIDPLSDSSNLAAQIYQWLAGAVEATPDQRRLVEFARQALTAKPDRLPELKWGAECLRAWGGMIVRATEPDPAVDWPSELIVGQCSQGPWGKCDWEQADSGQGLPEGMLLGVVPALSMSRLTLPNRPRKSMKKSLQELRVPPWWRSYLPVFEHKGTPVWAVSAGPLAGLEQYATTRDEPRLAPVWQAGGAV